MTPKPAPGKAASGGELGRALPYLLMACILGYFLYQFLGVRETSDDTYIALRYARNFVDGHGLVFNPGERVEGYSDFLWVVLISVLMKTGVDPRLATKVLGFAAGSGTLVLLFAMSRTLYRKTVPGYLHVIPAALLASYSYYAYWCAQGLESPLFIFLIVGGAYFYLAEQQGGSRYLSPVFFALSALTRPEGPMFLGLTFMHRVVVSRTKGRPLKDDLLWLAPFFAIFLPHLIWRYSYYGYLVPNTFYAKSEFDMVQVAGGWQYLKNAVGTLGIFWPALLALPFLPFATRRRFPEFIYLFALLSASLAYIVVIGGDIQTFCRFLVHFVPLLFVLIYMAVAEVYVWAGDRRGAAMSTVAAAAAVAVAATACYTMAVKTSGYTKYLPAVEMWAEVGSWIKENTPPETLIAVTNAGATPYFAERPTLDMLGLNDEYIAHNPDYTTGKTVNEKKYNSGYVLSRKPDIVVFRFCDWPRASCELDLFNREEFRDFYVPMNIQMKSGVYTLYMRLPDDKVRRTGSGYIEDLGREYGYTGRGALGARHPVFLSIMERVLAASPNMVNHYKMAHYYYGQGDYAAAEYELDIELSVNPGFAPAYLVKGAIANMRGDREGFKRNVREFYRHSTVQVPEEQLESQIYFCF